MDEPLQILCQSKLYLLATHSKLPVRNRAYDNGLNLVVYEKYSTLLFTQ